MKSNTANKKEVAPKQMNVRVGQNSEAAQVHARNHGAGRRAAISTPPRPAVDSSPGLRGRDRHRGDDPPSSPRWGVASRPGERLSIGLREEEDCRYVSHFTIPRATWERSL